MTITELGLLATLMFAAVAGLTRLVVPWLARRGVVDVPNERSSHVSATPRGGGIVLVGLLIAIGLVSAFRVDLPGLGLVAAAAAVLMLLSFIDDLYSLAASIRFIVQGIVIAICTVTLASIWPPLPLWIVPTVMVVPLVWLAWVWFTNLCNFMDGIDGIVGVEMTAIGIGVLAVLVASGIDAAAVHADLRSATIIAALLLATGAAGFLTVNWHPALVFLGDVGSITLGFLAGALLFALSVQGYAAAALILPAYFVADATTTLVLRAWRREPLSKPHRSHAYQLAVSIGMLHSSVCLMVSALNVLLVGLALISLTWPVLSLMTAYALACALCVWFRLRHVAIRN